MSKISIVKEVAEEAITAETDRTALLVRKAEQFAMGTVVIMGFQLWDARLMVGSSSPVVMILCYLSLAALTSALFLAFRCLKIKGYASYPRGNKLWDTLKAENVSDDAAEEALVQMLLKNREQNALLNDAKCNSLFWCGWLLFAGILLVAGSQLLDALLEAPL